MKTVYIKRNDLFKNIPMILCNNITQVDENFFEENSELFTRECEYCKNKDEKRKKCEECNGEGYHDLEVYQYFIASMTDWDKEQFKEYNVPFGYSNLLDVDIIPIYDFGTMWTAFSYSKEVEDDYTLAHNETLKHETPY